MKNRLEKNYFKLKEAGVDLAFVFNDDELFDVLIEKVVEIGQALSVLEDTKIGEYEEKIDELEDQVEELESEVDQLEKDKAILEDENEDLLSKIEELEDAVQTLTGALNS